MRAIKRSHIRLLVNRFKDCFLFYRDILDLPVRYGDENSNYAEFKSDAIHIALFKRILMAKVVDKADQLLDADIQDRVALVLRVDDVTAVYKKLMAKGVEFVTGPVARKEWGCRTSHLRDPDGNLIEINGDL
ncbi:MAG: VOC family protein [Deltaproteobacteria bacterium]|nr:VOC family protein [Deltaproteobacteria bacterium]MBW2201333.1 VOC family protein [Deltaproteobacteria bacterium]MBW2592782.1 VOC family protein [Deltaproteobacteria bacterium]